MRWIRLRNACILVALIVSVLVVVSGCQLSTEVFTEKNRIPEKVTEHLDDEATLQLVNEGSKGAYIIFRSEGNVEAETSVEDNEITIDFNVTNKDDDLQEHVYYLKEDLTYDTIRVFVNDDEIPFTNVTGM